MIPSKPEDVTATALAEYARIDDPRQRELVLAAIRHVHAFATETRLTEAEFQRLCRVIASLGQATTPSHNEVVLAAGSTGLSALVCLLNKGQRGQHETTANLMVPFWREGSPRVEPGSLVARQRGGKRFTRMGRRAGALQRCRTYCPGASSNTR